MIELGGAPKKTFLVRKLEAERKVMELSLVIAAATCLAMIAAVLFFPKVNIGRISLSSYWVVTVVGAILLLLLGVVDIGTVGAALVADTAINPLKILVLFISMTVLSIFL